MAGELDLVIPDASVAVKWFLSDEDQADQALLLLSRFLEGQTRLVAPAYIRYEVPSAIAVATRGRQARITPEQGRQAIADFLALRLNVADTDDLITHAYDLAQQHGCSIYDAYYLALAAQIQAPFLTADRRLYERVAGLSYVLWLGDYAAPDVP